MKRMILTALVGVVMFSSTSFAEWTKVGENVDGNTRYVDFERIKNIMNMFISGLYFIS